MVVLVILEVASQFMFVHFLVHPRGAASAPGNGQTSLPPPKFLIMFTKTLRRIDYLKIKIPWSQIREFCACIFYGLNVSALRRKRRKCAAFCRFLFCRKGLTGLRRGPCRKTAVAPLWCESGPVAEPGGPPWSAAAVFSTKNGGGTGKRRCFFCSAVSILRFSRGPFFGILFLHHEGRTRGL